MPLKKMKKAKNPVAKKKKKASMDNMKVRQKKTTTKTKKDRSWKHPAGVHE